MEKLFSLEYGIGGVCVLLTIMVLIKVGEFVWAIREKKEILSDNVLTELNKTVQSNTIALQMLELRLRNIETTIADIPKLRNDLRRFYSAIKEMAGEKWPKVRDEIMKDGFNT